MASWERRDWSKCIELVKLQTEAVENGLFVLVNGEPAQPDLRFQRLLLGVCSSFAGDFVAAAQHFRVVLERAHFDPPDQVLIAAARWAGDTFVVLTESVNAAMAWSAALVMSVKYFRGPSGDSAKIAADLRYLNQWTNALTILKTYLMTHNRVIDTAFHTANPDWKRRTVTDAIAHTYRVPPRDEPVLTPNKPSFRLTAGLLTQPLPDAYILSLETSAALRLPCERDPTFRAESAICLLSVLARPKMDVPLAIPTLPLGRGRRALFFSTDEAQPRSYRRGGGQREWLVRALRDCLNAYALEFKVVGPTVLVRLSQTHPGSRLAFYRCFGIRFRRLAMRPTCVGLKMTGALFATREFESLPAFGDEGGRREGREEAPGEDVVREQLIERVRGFLVERAAREAEEGAAPAQQQQQQQQPEAPPPQFELPGSAPGFEMPASTQLPVELEGRSMWRRTRAKRGGSVAQVFELPA